MEIKWNGNGYDKSNDIAYSIKDGKGLIKEYEYDDKLIFEGEYLNRYKNGKGKQYDNKGKLIFEGEYSYNKIRKGKVYINDRLKYEGEYLNYRKKNGKGYDEYGSILYELIDGTGKAKEYQFF